MPKKKKRKPHRNGELDVLWFEELPSRCKEIFFDYLFRSGMGETKKQADLFFAVGGSYINEDCKSPIEKIFDYAMQIVNFEEETETRLYVPSWAQYPIKIGDKQYYADFLFDTEFVKEHQRKYEAENRVRLIVECDGHEFHEKTKEQVKHDNERDLALKMAGFDVLHFSGSQIFNEPIECATQVFNYIQSKVGKWKLVEGD